MNDFELYVMKFFFFGIPIFAFFLGFIPTKRWFFYLPGYFWQLQLRFLYLWLKI
jgi:hypothetical protein